MFTKRRILAFTGIRSDYDLMSLIYKEMNKRETFEIGLVVSGAHLSETYGYTCEQIEKDGIPIVAKIENLFDSNSKGARLKSLAILLQDSISHIEKFNPDAIIFAGDREEVMVGGLVGSYLRIPTIHFFGGDHATDGNVDNVIRHATSKLANIHFVAHDEAKKRLINMGEESFRIFNMGSPALDKFKNTELITKKELLNKLMINNFNNYAVVIFHPIIGEEKSAGRYFEEILITLKNRNIKACISYPNVDAGNKEIITMLRKYENEENFYFYKNLDRNLFVNLLRHCEFLIGNSSLGLFEAPLIKKPVINVGSRQKGRLAPSNVVFVDQGIDNINTGIQIILSKKFKKQLQKVISIYGDGNSVNKIVDSLENIQFNKYLIKSYDPLKGVE